MLKAFAMGFPEQASPPPDGKYFTEVPIKSETGYLIKLQLPERFGALDEPWWGFLCDHYNKQGFYSDIMQSAIPRVQLEAEDIDEFFQGEHAPMENLIKALVDYGRERGFLEIYEHLSKHTNVPIENFCRASLSRLTAAHFEIFDKDGETLQLRERFAYFSSREKTPIVPSVIPFAAYGLKSLDKIKEAAQAASR